MLTIGNIAQIGTELSQFPPCEMWIVAGRKINFISKPDDESSSDEDDDMEDIDECVPSGPSTSGSTMQVVEEDVDPGWTKVKSKKRK